MDFGHDTACALATVVDLVNTDPEVAGDEAMGDLADLDDLVRRCEISEAGPLTDHDLAAVLRLRARLRAVFAAPDEAAAVRLVNDLVADARTTPRLSSRISSTNRNRSGFSCTRGSGLRTQRRSSRRTASSRRSSTRRTQTSRPATSSSRIPSRERISDAAHRSR